jgi:hypothetical protein
MFKQGRKPGPKRVKGQGNSCHSKQLEWRLSKTKVCLACNVEKNLTHFFNEFKRYWSICKKCHLKNKSKSMSEYLERDELFNKCYHLILDFQKKSYHLDQIDLMRLIDIWDDIYPYDSVPAKVDFNKIMLKVYSWFIKERERIIKTEL